MCLASIPTQPERNAAGKAASQAEGQALVEFALIVPLVFFLAVNAVNFGGFLFAWITVASAARSGVQYMTMSSASPGAPAAATPALIGALVTNDVFSLLNKSSIVVLTCTNNTASAGCGTLPDPEAPAYTLATVDVTYTYKPLIPLFSFPKLGIGATLPPGTIHRKAVMRMLQ
jgi:Flp pilus assembly protein TadG